MERGGTHDFGVDSIEQMQFTPYRPILHTCLLLSERHPLAPPQPHSTPPIYSLPNPHPLLRTGTLQIRSYNQSGVCSVEGCSHALWRPCPHSTRFSSRQSTDWFRGLGWEYFFEEWGFSFWGGAFVIGVGRIRHLHRVWVSHVAGVGRYFLEWETPLGVGH